MVVEVFVEEVVPLGACQGAEGVGVFVVEMVCTELLGFGEVIDQSFFFFFKIFGIGDPKMGGGLSVFGVGFFVDHAVFDQQFENPFFEGARFWVKVGVDGFVGYVAVSQHLPDRHFAPEGLRFGGELVDALNKEVGFFLVEDVLHVLNF